MNSNRRKLVRWLLIGCGVIGSLVLSWASSGIAWGGADAQTIPTVTATVVGEAPVIALPDGLAPVDDPVTQPAAFELSQFFLPVGCCLLFCLIGLVPAGIVFNLLARRQNSNAKTH